LSALHAALFSSAKSDWRTPDALFARLSEQWGPFNLDAAATKDDAKCERFIGPERDGLAVMWKAFRVWVNPPYARGVTGKWVAKALAESKRPGGPRVVMLLPSRTDSPWFHDLVRPHAFHVEFIRGRVRLQGATSGAPFPSMVVVFEGSL
jgi:phage N-6-adenine-methyltransferase